MKTYYFKTPKIRIDALPNPAKIDITASNKRNRKNTGSGVAKAKRLAKQRKNCR